MIFCSYTLIFLPKKYPCSKIISSYFFLINRFIRSLLGAWCCNGWQLWVWWLAVLRAGRSVAWRVLGRGRRLRRARPVAAAKSIGPPVWQWRVRNLVAAVLRAVWPLTILACRNIWRGNVRLPRGKTITYRYMVCILVPSDGEQLMEMVRVVKRWETHPQSRRITQQGIAVQRNLTDFINTSKFWIDLERAHCREDPEEFGLVSGLQQVERGWLTSETVVQLKIFGDEPIKMWKRRLLNKQVIGFTLRKCAHCILFNCFQDNF